MTIISECLSDLQDAVTGIHEVLIPDWLDDLGDLDWLVVDQLQGISKTLNRTILMVCDRYRTMLASRYVPSAGNGAPPRAATPPGSGG